MANPFSKLGVTILPNNTRVLSWQFLKGATIPQEAIISVQYARAGGQWQTLATGLPVSYCYNDTRAFNKNKYNNDFYRLVLQTQNQKYISQPQMAGITSSYPYSAQASNLTRLSQLQIQKTGRKGYLLKKIVWGKPCPVCQQFKDDSPVNQHCPNCLGTGKDGGYYKAIPLGILQEGQNSTQAMGPQGLMVNNVISAKCTAWPLIQYGDVWSDYYTNQRYYINKISVISKYKHIPLVYSLNMSLIQQSDILHSETADQLLQEAHVDYSNKDWEKAFE